MSAQPHRTDQEDGVPSYLTRLTQVPLLTSEEEVVLTRAIQKGDKLARQRLIESNMRLVINIAKSYRSRAVPLEDLIQEGAIGLMQAAERFDPDKGFRFSTYATHWVRQAIGRAIDNKSKAIRLPAHVSQSVRRIERERVRLMAELGTEPSTEQIAAALGIPVKKMLLMLQSAQELLSLDLPVGEAGSNTLGGLLPDRGGEDAESIVIGQEVLTELGRILRELSEREQRVMRLRFRLDESENSAYFEGLGGECKMNKERVRQVEIQAIKKLRSIAQQRKLNDVFGE
jgi:RNA polymerase primary sigma factor